ncbi:ComEA family DNA-binding protein [Shewanella waksmanii]|uniref:ComEA family DNA-binding protein n=1 Tax=Shewanella waksmanii TaxID=213783 RepID=UPI003735AC4E
MKSMLLLAALAAASIIYTPVEAKDSQVTAEQSVIVQPVNINTASQSQLAILNGLGEVKAQAIVDYRSKHGAFTDINQLTNVKGIGTKFIEKNRTNIRL